MADHKHGEMDTTVQQAAFDGFMTWLIRGTIVTLVLLVLLALFGA